MPGKSGVRKTALKQKDDSLYQQILNRVPKERRLRVMRVKRCTLLNYHSHVEDFKQWCHYHKRKFSNPVAADKSMSVYFLHLYEDGNAVSFASYTLFGWITLMLMPDRPERELMPLSRAALTAWKGSHIAKSRVGVPPEVVYKFSQFCIEQGNFDCAMASLLQFDLYARPSEVLSLKGRDIIPPVCGLQSKWGVLFGNAEFGERSKAGTVDDAIFADTTSRVWCNQLLKHIGRFLVHQDVPIFQCSLNQFEELCRQFSKQFKLPSGVFTPHVIRHSGPSVDVIHGQRSLEEVQARGRWAAPASVRRYRKPGRLLLQSSRLPKIFLSRAKSALDSALTTLLSKWVPSTPSP